LTDPNLKWKEAVFSRFKQGDGVITEQYNYAEYENGENMLYDLHIDPDENTNVSSSDEHADIIVELSQILKDGWQNVEPKVTK